MLVTLLIIKIEYILLIMMKKSDNDNRTLSDGKTLEESVNDIVIKLRNKSVNAYYNSYNVVHAVSEKRTLF
jgi:hypothetical protein